MFLSAAYPIVVLIGEARALEEHHPLSAADAGRLRLPVGCMPFAEAGRLNMLFPGRTGRLSSPAPLRTPPIGRLSFL